MGFDRTYLAAELINELYLLMSDGLTQCYRDGECYEEFELLERNCLIEMEVSLFDSLIFYEHEIALCF